ncbi:MAG TPA: MotA/TolQ/ExbB proton channel family protein [Desulfatiglandales bacterium]|nr:MotA/TolQ/ExbB proton channel family protein [Desulfatiglandales bacterium]
MNYYDLYLKTIEFFQLGGMVMYPLITACFIMWLLIFKKLMDIHYLSKGTRTTDEILRSMGKSGFTAALWQRQIIDGYCAEVTENKKLNENILISLNIRQKSYLEKYTSTIALLATIAPLMGLLGTVTGMIKTFDVISTFGTGNARALAAGISEALITTETGLVLAVPGLFFVSFIQRHSNELAMRIQRFCIRLQNAQIKAK